MRLTARWFLLVLSSVCFGVAFPQAIPPKDTIYVGILDDAREEAWHGKEGLPGHRIIMPAFQRGGSDWEAISSFDSSATRWTIAFDGESLGQVESENLADDAPRDQINSSSSRAKLGIRGPQTTLPIRGTASDKFTGVSALFGLKKVRRPLVVVSKPYFRDPDGWKRAGLPRELTELVRAGFRRQFPRVDRCEQESIAEKDWKYPDSAVSVTAAYASNKDTFLVATRLNAGDCGWGGHPDDPLDSFVDQWFFVASDRSVRRIGGFGDLLDAGDYDNDGESEVIFFSVRSESSDAYDLLYHNFQKKAELEVRYR